MQPQAFHESADDHPLSDTIAYSALGDNSVTGLFRLLAYLFAFIVLFGTSFGMLIR
jgi:hypothetical protein